MKNAVLSPRKQEEPTEGKPEDTLETKNQELGRYRARHGSPDDTLDTDRTQPLSALSFS